LPYNLTESAWEAAQKFLEANELPMTYYEQVANWIADNTRGAKFGQESSAPAGQTGGPAAAKDPWGSDNRYRPGDASSGSGGRKLPQRSYATIVEGNPTNAINLIIDKAKASNDLTEDDVAALQNLSHQLQNKDDPRPTSTQTAALLKIMTTWSQKARVPAVGLLALCAVSQTFVAATSAGDTTIVDPLSSAGVLAPKQETANNVVHGIRTLVNLFKTDAGRLIADGTFDSTLKAVRPFASDAESAAQAKALATLYLNYAVLLTSSAPSSESKPREARAELLMRDIAFFLESDSPHAADADALYRTLAALGTLITLGSDFRQKMKMGISGTLHVAGTKPGAQRQDTKDLVAEIRDELR
jgi:phospholipase A-2-activating protein